MTFSACAWVGAWPGRFGHSSSTSAWRRCWITIRSTLVSLPTKSPAVLCGIASMQASEGIWYPLGGTGAVPAALTRLALDLGVEIRNEVGVKRILHQAGVVIGVETNTGEKVQLSAVVSNMDSVRTHRELLGVEFKARKPKPACRRMVLYLA